MWVMTSFGILMPSVRPPGTVDPLDNRTLQIRARREKDLSILRDEYMGDALGPTWETPEMDYNFRAYCTPEAWGRALYDMAQQIDYQKFKPTTEDYYGDAELHSVYNQIWGTVCRLNAPWGGRRFYEGGSYWGDSEMRWSDSPDETTRKVIDEWAQSFTTEDERKALEDDVREVLREELKDIPRESWKEILSPEEYDLMTGE